MKKLAASLLFLTVALHAFPQCTPDFNISAVGFYPPDSLLPCAEDSLYFDEVLQFKNFDQVYFAPFGFVTIVSVQIDSVRNMPAGLSYECNSPNCYYLGADNGCVRISGTTNVPTGVYNLGFYATLMVDIGTGPFQYPADSQLLANNGLGYSIVVINQGGACPHKHSGQLYLNSTVMVPSYCEGDTVPFHTLASGGAIPYSYSWSPSSNLSDPNIADPMLYPTNPGKYTVTATDNNGLWATDSVEVVYTPVPSISLTADTSVCPGDSVQLEASGGDSYNWSPAISLSAADISNPLAYPSQNTTYTVIVSTNNCSATDDVTVAVDTVYPNAAFNTIENNFTVFFNNTSSGASSYYWDFGDGDTSIVKNPQHQYAQHAVYEVKLIVGNSCGYSDTLISAVDLSVGIAAIPNEPTIKIYPNPGIGLFHLKIEKFSGSELSYEVTSLCGEVLKSESLRIQKEDILQLNLTDYSKGIYFLKITSGNFQTFRKIILQ